MHYNAVKILPIPWLWQSIHVLYVLLKSTSSTSTKSPLQAEDSTFSAKAWTKIPLRMHHAKHTNGVLLCILSCTFHFQVKFLFFWGRGLTTNPSPPSSIPDPYLRSPRIPARSTPLNECRRNRIIATVSLYALVMIADYFGYMTTASTELCKHCSVICFRATVALNWMNSLCRVYFRDEELLRM